MSTFPPHTYPPLGTRVGSPSLPFPGFQDPALCCLRGRRSQHSQRTTQDTLGALGGHQVHLLSPCLGGGPGGPWWGSRLGRLGCPRAQLQGRGVPGCVLPPLAHCPLPRTRLSGLRPPGGPCQPRAPKLGRPIGCQQPAASHRPSPATRDGGRGCAEPCGSPGALPAPQASSGDRLPSAPLPSRSSDRADSWPVVSAESPGSEASSGGEGASSGQGAALSAG